MVGVLIFLSQSAYGKQAHFIITHLV